MAAAPERLTRTTRRHYRKHHRGLAAGALLTSAQITGALLIGDSLRETLRERHALRLGQAGPVLEMVDRFFTDALGAAFEDPEVVTLLKLPGSLATQDGSLRANRVQILGVDEAFWKLAPSGKPPPGWEPDDGMWVNQALAERLGLKVGDTALLRTAKPSLMPIDAAFSEDQGRTATLRAKVAGIVEPAHWGNMSLRDQPGDPLNVFISRKLLQEKAELTGRSNTLIAARGADQAALESVLKASWRLDDAALTLVPRDGGVLELKSSRVFIDPRSEAAILSKVPPDHAISTYFVNALRAHDRMTPYSSVAAIGGDGLPGLEEETSPPSVVIHSWLADDLKAREGDEITMEYYVMGPLRELEEVSQTFRVAKVIPMEGWAADPTLMPDFPGISDADHCRDWDPSMPIDMDRIRPDVDEKYWEEHKGTPKAFISTATAEKLWRSRYGVYTSFRYGEADQPARTGRIRDALSPEWFGLTWKDTAAAAQQAVQQGMDFGGLFIGMSFFLILSALALPAMMLLLHLEQRRPELATLLAVGFPAKRIVKLRLQECTPTFLMGALAGIPAGVLYGWVVRFLLNGGWSPAGGGLHVVWSWNPTSLITGPLLTFGLFLFLAWSRIRKHTRKNIAAMLGGGGENPEIRKSKAGARWTGLAMGLTSFVLLGVSLNASNPNPATAFGAGALLLTSGLAFFKSWAGITRGPLPVPFTLGGLARGNLSRKTARGLTVAGLLASGVFMVFSAGAFRLDAARETGPRSGSGGFAWIMETAQPLSRDLNDPLFREDWGLDRLETHWQAVPFRVREGDEASCLNPGRAQQPRVLAVNPEVVAGHYLFAQGDWADLQTPLENGEIPVLADLNTLQWALHAMVGDQITLTAEDGSPFAARVVGALQQSVLQGAVIMGEKNFQTLFPSAGGYRMIFIETEAGQELTSELGRRLLEYGPEFETVKSRMNTYFSVQNTYINIFQALGGMGVFLGAFGMALITRRNLLERRGELAALRGLGFSVGRLRTLLVKEHQWFLLGGVILGLAASLPTLLPMRHAVSMEALAGLLVLAVGMVAAALGTIRSGIQAHLKRPVQEALAEE